MKIYLKTKLINHKPLIIKFFIQDPAKVLLFFENTKSFWIKVYGEHNFVIKLLLSYGKELSLRSFFNRTQ